MVQRQRWVNQKTRTDIMEPPGGLKILKGGAQSQRGSKLCVHENLYLNACFFLSVVDFS